MRSTATIAALATVGVVLAGCSQPADNSPDEPSSSFPESSLTLVVPYGPGGSTDPIARELSLKADEAFGQSLTVINREGGGGVVGTTEGLGADPDGYTVTFGAGSPLTVAPLIEETAYRGPDDGYQTVVGLGESPMLVVVQASAPWETLEEFLDAAADAPGTLRLSTAGLNTIPELAVEAINKAADVELVAAPFSGGSGEAVVALLGGQVEASLTTPASVIGQVEAGELRVLASLSDDRLPALEDVPTAIEEGVDVSMGSVLAIIVPMDTPADVLEQLRAGFLKIVDTDDYRDFLAQNGYLAGAVTAEDMATRIDDALDLNLELLKDLGRDVRE
jgi:tripartite-type tricarboxylate transporter receptor subunit TctC